MQQPDLIEVFLYPIEKQQFRYFVTGSIAAIFYGEPRLTHDIDLVLCLDPKEIGRFIGLFGIDEFYCPPEEVIRIEMQRKPFGHFNLIHHRTGLKADIYTSSSDPLHEWAFGKRKRIQLTAELSLWIAPPEYIIIRKLEYYREGKSTKHVEDIQKMMPQIGSSLDRAFLNKEMSRRGLEKYAAKIPALFKGQPQFPQ